MTEGIWIAIIAAVQALSLGVLGKVSRDSSTTRKEVKNSHSTNLREELDERHHEQMSELRGIRKDVGRLDTRDIQRGEEIRDLTRKVDKHLDWSAEWSADIEDTLNPRKDRP
ncbi:hypothetical protein [Leucobacter tenebrionis]|uniref:hypothetical protein n=1 Tax=Leucobacter tenebrionis TaxID=2873270 RepID=UPI001CA63703|nr:hypothetical protein [Leucobacter tenebrionis]QZY52935.1 hypothetical protein KVY00_05735 [Leucobacter tenebrionis]